MRVHMPPQLRNTAISVIALVLLLLAAGMAYTYFSGRNTPAALPVEPVVVTEPAPFIKPPKVAPNARESASVQMVSSPVVRGSAASITVKTNPTSKCTITVMYGNKAAADSGLTPKQADEYGMVSWTWLVEKSVPVGSWPVTVTCTYNNHSAVVQASFLVTET